MEFAGFVIVNVKINGIGTLIALRNFVKKTVK